MVLLLVFAFISGLVTILAPCIWPLLPIVLSSSVGGKSHTRPLGIAVGIMASFTIFTLAISYIVRIFHLDPNILRLFAVFVLVLLGFSMIIPSLSQIIEGGVSRLSRVFGRTGQTQQSDFRGGFITGLSLGIVWSPCSGPILASIATLAATGQVTLSVILVTLSYVAGVGIPLFAFAYGGQKIIGKTRFLSAYTGRIQQVFGVVMLLTAVAIYTNYDKVIQLKLLDVFPSYSQALTSFEKSSEVQKQLAVLKGKNNDGLVSAPEFTGITHWLNSEPLSMESLRGKVVLVDFWTYTCINCIRTLPHVTGWYEKYKDKGFVVVGVHTPEFEFEKNTKNVQNALQQYGIHYPVAQDNSYATWNAFSNQYWPAKYLIDAKGVVRYTHFGEGEYDKTETAIQTLLKEAGRQVQLPMNSPPDQTPPTRLTPETYLGLRRGEGRVQLSGSWNVQDEYAESGKTTSLTLTFYANKVFLVITPKDVNSVVKVFLDNTVVNGAVVGKDIRSGTIVLDTPRLYELIDLHGIPGNHMLRLEFLTPGVKLFAFTFG